MHLVKVERDAVETGVTPDGWLEQKASPVVHLTFQSDDGKERRRDMCAAGYDGLIWPHHVALTWPHLGDQVSGRNGSSYCIQREEGQVPAGATSSRHGGPQGVGGAGSRCPAGASSGCHDHAAEFGAICGFARGDWTAGLGQDDVHP